MNICFIISSLKKPAGTERVATLLSNELSIKHKISIICRDEYFVEPSFQLSSNINIKKMPGSLIDFYKKLRVDIVSSQYDIIFVHNMGKLTPFVLISAKDHQSLVSIEHTSFSTKNVILKLLCKILYKNLFRVVAINTNDENEFKKIINPKKVLRIPNPSPFTPCLFNNEKDNEKNIIAIGRLSYEKNFSALIKAWCLLGDKTIDWKLNIYGDGEEREKLKYLIENYNCKNIYLFPSTKDISRIYEKSHFLVMSSLYEGFGMVLIEAMSFGKPVISFNCPHGPSDIIENYKNGILVENGNINELSKSIGMLIENKKLRDRLSIGAFQTSMKYNISEIIKQWEKILQSVI